jgi:hypothetical protein
LVLRIYFLLLLSGDGERAGIIVFSMAVVLKMQATTTSSASSPI